MIIDEAVERRSKRFDTCTHAFCTPGPKAEMRTMPKREGGGSRAKDAQGGFQPVIEGTRRARFSRV
jgi:hypothetical protein